MAECPGKFYRYVSHKINHNSIFTVYRFFCQDLCNKLNDLKVGFRVLARIWKMPVQIRHSEISAHPDLATNVLQIVIPTTLNSLLCQKGQITLPFSHVLEDGSFRKYLVINPKKSKLKILHRNFACPKRRSSDNCLSERQAGWVLAKYVVGYIWPLALTEAN